MTSPADRKPVPASGNLPEQVASLVVIAVSGIALQQASKLPFGSLHSPEAGFVPTLESVVLGVCGLALLIQAIAGRRTKPIGFPEGAARRAALRLSGALVGLVVLLPLIGFTAAAFLFLWLGIYLPRKYSPFTSALLALAITAGLHLVFVAVLKMPLPSGSFDPF